jgi:Na+/H+-dicarboxylate symporter
MINWLEMIMLKYLQNRSLQTILVITIYAFTAQYIPDTLHRLFYTISVLIKDLLMLMMPITVFSFIAYTISSFKRKAPIFIISLMLFEFISNFSSIWYAIGSGYMVSTSFSGFEIIKLESDFTVLWKFPLVKPVWWSADKGSIIGVIVGCYIAFRDESHFKPMLEILKSVMEFVLTKIFAKLIPIFVLGFSAQIYKTGILSHMISHYSILVLYLVFFICVYISLISLSQCWI